MSIRINIAVWVGLTMLVAIFGVARKWPAYSLLKHYAVIQGHVSQKLPQEHQSFYFIYEVEHRIYTSIGGIDTDFNKIQVGDPITVYYDKRQPEICTLNRPKVDLARAIGMVIAQCAIIPLIAMIFLHRFKIISEWNLFNKVRLASK
jgi:hypothetical protein